jgi:penicillin-binding protein 1A
MRVLLAVVTACVGIVVLALVVGLCWFRFYTRDLPDIDSLVQFAPTSARQVFDPCFGAASTIPYDGIGSNLRMALNAVGFSEAEPSVLSVTFHGFAGGPHPKTATVSWQISRSMFCAPSKSLPRQIAELRTAEHLERRYSGQQLFTIYANRAYFGDNLIGVQAAANHYFGKPANQLSIPEAALIAGLVNSPSRYSPVKHPDRAVQRRNEVIDAEFQNNSIALAEAEAAKSAPLGVIAGVSAPAAR